MTNPTPAQTTVLKDRLLTNIVSLPNMLSVKYGAIVLAIWGAWSAFPKESQDALIASLHIPTGWLPALTFLGFVITRVWPQLNMPAPAETPTLTEVVPDSIPIVDTAALDAEWVETIQAVYPEMTERHIERLMKVRAMARREKV